MSYYVVLFHLLYFISSYLTFVLLASDGMEKDLINGTTLVVDRYAFSGVAYTSAKVCIIDMMYFFLNLHFSAIFFFQKSIFT